MTIRKFEVDAYNRKTKKSKKNFFKGTNNFLTTITSCTYCRGMISIIRPRVCVSSPSCFGRSYFETWSMT